MNEGLKEAIESVVGVIALLFVMAIALVGALVFMGLPPLLITELSRQGVIPYWATIPTAAIAFLVGAAAFAWIWNWAADKAEKCT